MRTIAVSAGILHYTNLYGVPQEVECLRLRRADASDKHCYVTRDLNQIQFVSDSDHFIPATGERHF